jgi:hypothetical protein
LIAIGVAMALIELVYIFLIWAHLYQYYSNNLNFIFSIFYMLPTPLIVLGVALFLLKLTESKKGMATWSRMIFFCGAVLFIISGLFTIALQFEVVYYEDWAFNLNIMAYLSLTAAVLSILGTVLCAIAILFLVKAYLNGEIHVKRASHL